MYTPHPSWGWGWCCSACCCLCKLAQQVKYQGTVNFLRVVSVRGVVAAACFHASSPCVPPIKRRVVDLKLYLPWWARALPACPSALRLDMLDYNKLSLIAFLCCCQKTPPLPTAANCTGPPPAVSDTVWPTSCQGAVPTTVCAGQCRPGRGGPALPTSTCQDSGVWSSPTGACSKGKAAEACFTCNACTTFSSDIP